MAPFSVRVFHCALHMAMGIVGDSETCIFEHLSFVDTQDAQQRVTNTARSAKQLTVAGQINTVEMSSQQDEVSQLLSVTHQDSVSLEHISSRSQHSGSSSSAEETIRRISLSSSSDGSSVTSDISDIQRSPPLESSLMPLSPFRECLSLIERTEAALDLSQLQRRSQSESVGSSSPYKSRIQSTWFEQSDVYPADVDDKRTFSYEHMRCCSPESEAQRQVSTPSDDSRNIQSELGLPYSKCTTVEETISESEVLPQESLSRRLERKFSTHQLGPLPESSVMTPKDNTSETDRTISNVDEESHDTRSHPPNSSRSQQLSQYSVGVSVTTFSKPKLLRLKSEPCTFGTLTPEEILFEQQCERNDSKRRRDELKRSQSFEVNTSSYTETLWPRGSNPSHILVTRPQLFSRLKGNHLSLHLEGS